MLYRRKVKRPDGAMVELPTWWVKYYVDGRPIRRSCKTAKDTEARRLLKHWEGHPRTTLPVMDRLTFEEMMTAVVADQEAQGRHTVGHTRQHIATLGTHFAGRRVIQITRADVDAYVAARLKAGLARGSVGRELAMLRRGFRLAMAAGRLTQAPGVPSLAGGIRKGFVGEADYRRLHAVLPEAHGDLLTVGFAIGWRIGELLNLTWDHVDVEHGILRLEAGEAKNDEPREVHLAGFPQLWEVFKRRAAAAGGIPWVFWNRRGRPIRYQAFNKAWKAGCRKAGVDYLFHDLRRTTVRNLEAAGVPRSVATRITGHKSEAVYRRYAITRPEDTRNALAKVAALVGYQMGLAETVREALAGTLAGTGQGGVRRVRQTTPSVTRTSESLPTSQGRGSWPPPGTDERPARRPAPSLSGSHGPPGLPGRPQPSGRGLPGGGGPAGAGGRWP